MRVRACVHKLLLRVGRKHPQALIYPLAVASHEARGQEGSATVEAQRGAGAVRILQAMRAHCDTLVEQALLVSTELIRKRPRRDGTRPSAKSIRPRP